MCRRQREPHELGDAFPDSAVPAGKELTRLAAMLARTFADSVDLDRAGTADVQGIAERTVTQAGISR